MPRRKKHTRVRIIIILILAYIILSIISLYYKPFQLPNATESVSGKQIANLEIPKSVGQDFITKHPGYTLSYNENYEVADWVAYEITRADIYGNATRSDDFRIDPTIPTGSAALEDYRGSGYDRGHLLPSAARKASENEQSATFYMSNMSMQAPKFNRGIWKELEETVRTFADRAGRVYVVSGPVLTDGPFKTVGKDKVAVPKEFYKVVLVDNPDETKGIGFIVPNEGSKKDPKDFAVSIDKVEQLTDLDFYPNLPDTIENKVEAQCNVNDWDWNTFSASGKADSTATENTSTKPSYEKPEDQAKDYLNKVMANMKTTTLSFLLKYISAENLQLLGIDATS
ncbi:MAG: DNA/RNA non-specific endonuclease [Spirochaetia bacterium]|jgi:endonuclease G|nr:DNA/RNA non-specific endonuclease [Spirochaetia bacterium]